MSKEILGIWKPLSFPEPIAYDLTANAPEVVIVASNRNPRDSGSKPEVGFQIQLTITSARGTT